MLPEVAFTRARQEFSGLYDKVFRDLSPLIIKRRGSEQVLLLRPDVQREMLAGYNLRPEVVAEPDGSVTLALAELGLVASGPRRDRLEQNPLLSTPIKVKWGHRRWSSVMTMNVSQAKAKFLELVRRAENNENVIIEKKGVPVAAVLPYNEYADLKKLRDYLAMHKIYQATKDAAVTAREVHEESRWQLEARGSRD